MVFGAENGGKGFSWIFITKINRSDFDFECHYTHYTLKGCALLFAKHFRSAVCTALSKLCQDPRWMLLGEIWKARGAGLPHQAITLLLVD